MRPRPFLFACLLALGLTACGADEPPAPAATPSKDPGLYAGTTLEGGGLRLPARIQGRDLALAHRGRFAARFWPGVNLGVTVPGRSPGELAPARRDYDRWLDGMQDLGARVVRVYTILRPAFYDALAAHNRRNPTRRCTSFRASGSRRRSSSRARIRARSPQGSTPSSATPSPSCTATRRCPRAPATPPAPTAPTSPAGCSPGRPASSGPRSAVARHDPQAPDAPSAGPLHRRPRWRLAVRALAGSAPRPARRARGRAAAGAAR